MAFADHYPLATFAAIADASWWRTDDFDRPREGGDAHDPELRAAARDADWRDRGRLDSHETKFLDPAIRAHLADLQAKGALGATGGVAGRDVKNSESWNALVAGEPDTYKTAWLLHSLRAPFINAFVRMDSDRRSPERPAGVHVPPTADKVEAAWRLICESYDKGDSEAALHGWGIEDRDAISGDHCVLHFTGWQARLMRWTPAYELELAPDIVELPLAAVTVEIPTGKLLLTDYLRLEGIKEGIDLGRAEHAEASLNSERGCLRRTELHAERHGMAFCQTDNTMVEVFVSDTDGSIAFMPYGKKAMKGWTKAERYISCDVWRITALDRATAVRLAADGGNQDAEADLDRYLALADAPDVWTGEGVWADHMTAHHEQSYSRNVLRMDVVPGTWTFHSGPDFAIRVDRKALGLPRGAKPWAVLQSPRAA